jgi:hypothetical protein
MTFDNGQLGSDGASLKDRSWEIMFHVEQSG